MKRCKQYLDSLENDNQNSIYEAESHASHCSDCSFDKKINDKMLMVLNNLSEPEYPENLHELIMNASLDKKTDSSEEQSLYEKLSTLLLKPLEIVAPIACLVMLICMIQINTSENSEILEGQIQPKTSFKVEKASVPQNAEALEKVSPEEVKEFLAKLDEFKKLHPDNSILNNNLDIRLVNDR